MNLWHPESLCAFLNHEMLTVVVHPQIQTLYFPTVCCAFYASRFLSASQTKCIFIFIIVYRPRSSLPMCHFDRRHVSPVSS